MVFVPIERLKKGVEEIARGNYGVRVECDVFNDITLLVASFNDMAQKLQEGERIKSGYEENRRTLIANISHDLKTPITAIQGYIEAIMDRNDLSARNIEKYLQVIYRNTTYMNKLIDDLFLFSKLDLQKLDFNFESIAVNHFMRDLMEEFRVELEENAVDFSYVDRTARECLVRIDRKRIHQVFRNIIGNAVKYGPDSGLSINAAMYGQDKQVCIDIKDNGPGIPPDRLPYIFDRFYRLDDERTKDVMSTGLGLAIARELVEAHGGSISADSKEGRGSCFTIVLPVIEDDGGLQK
jgi:signal transduction histidine kinase